MNSAEFAGILSGLVIGMVLVIVILRLTKKDYSLRCKYDERQQLVRGRGFKYGFFTLMLYDIFYGFGNVILEKQVVDHMTAVFFGVFLGIAVYASYCIWHEGYFSLNENPKRVMLVFAILAVSNFIIFAVQILHGTVMKDGIITYHCVNLLCGVLFIIIFMVVFAKWFCNRREVE